MINEWEEFCAYTGTVSYTASKKSDTTWLGRFTFATILEFEGMARILTILARGYLFHSKDGAVISGDPHDRIDYARRALCAWCSVTEAFFRIALAIPNRCFSPPERTRALSFSLPCNPTISKASFSPV